MKLCIIGEMRAGKDTVSDLCQKLFPKLLFRNLKFGDPLLVAEKAVFDSFGLQVPEDKIKRRKFLQYLGTEFLENLGETTLLAKIFKKNYSDLILFGKHDFNFIITDARRDNQVYLAKSLGFKIVRIHRLERDRIAAGATSTNHASENLARDYPSDQLDYTLYNYGTIDDLSAKIVDMISYLYPQEIQ